MTAALTVDLTADQAVVLDLLRERGTRGILSTECIEIGVPNLQGRVRELREFGYAIGDVPEPGTRLIRYVLGAGSSRRWKEPWQSGVQVLWREGRGWSVAVMGTSEDKERAEDAAALIRSVLRGLDDQDRPGLLDE